MPAKRTTSKKAEPEPVEDVASADQAEDAEDPAPAEDEAPLNRAERRAKARGKGSRPDLPPGHGKTTTGHGPAPSHRMWSNRRSGG